MEQVIKEIGLSWKGRNRSFVLAVIMIVGALFLGATFKKLPLMPLIFGFIFLVIGFLNTNLKVFKFYQKHFVFQPSIAHKKMILNDNLVSFEIEKRKIIIIYKEVEKEKTIKLLKETLTDEDIDVLKRILNDIIVNRVGV